MIPPTSTEQILKISGLEGGIFRQSQMTVSRGLILSLREQFLEEHDFLSWDIVAPIASVATGQWIWSPSGAWRHWEPPHWWLGVRPKIEAAGRRLT